MGEADASLKRLSPPWMAFDAAWFRNRYKDRIGAVAGADDAALERFWREEGSAQGLSPSPLFDEGWYRARNADVVHAISAGIYFSGFEHYSEVGFRARDPHWLFSEQGYFAFNRDLSLSSVIAAGFANAYDHYLQGGDWEGRHSHRFFDPEVFRMACEDARLSHDGRYGGFAFLLGEPRARDLRTSWYFDPVWYARAYPDIAEAVAAGRYSSLLHHYLTNTTPSDFAPNAWFDEAFYLDSAGDVRSAIADGGFRNGYDHFLRFGAAEGRRPHPEVDLAAYAAHPDVMEAVAQGRFADPFAHWVASRPLQGAGEGAAGSGPDAEPAEITPAQRAWLLYEHVRTMLPVLSHAPLDFRCPGTPDVTLVVVGGDSIAPIVATAESLHGELPGKCALVLLDRGLDDTAQPLSGFIRGLERVRSAPYLPLASGLREALRVAHTDAVLVVTAGTCLAVGALAAGWERYLGSGGMAGASQPAMVTGQFVGPEGHVAAAGGTIFRDGTTAVIGLDALPFAPPVAFARECDGHGGGAVLCNASFLKRALETAPGATLPAVWTITALSVAEAGRAVWYEPCFVSRALCMPSTPLAPGSDDGLSAGPLPPDERARFHAPLATRAPAGPEGAAPGRWGGHGTRVLFAVWDTPDRRHGGLAAREADLIVTMVQAGARVTVLPFGPPRPPLRSLHAPESDRVEFLAAGGDPHAHLSEHGGEYDLVWLSGGVVARHFPPPTPGAPTARAAHVLDLGALQAEEAALRRHVDGAEDAALFASELRAELAPAAFCESIVALQAHDASLVAALGDRAPSIIGHSLFSVAGVPAFEARSGLLHSLPIAAAGDAVHDGLDAFARHVLPHLDPLLPAGADLVVAGTIRPPVDLLPLSALVRVAPICPVTDRDALYRARRVMVAPSRFASGLPYEVLRAATFGLPCVMGPDLAMQFGWTDGRECLVADLRDEAHFASCVARLYNERDLWQAVSARARAAAAELADPQSFARSVERILETAHAKRPG